MGFEDRLIDAVRKAMDEAGGAKQLAERIAKANGLREDSPPVDRRKLSAIASQSRNSGLTAYEIECLDNYFKCERHTSFALLSEHPLAMHRIAEHGSLTVVIGSKPDRQEARIDCSRWDVRSMNVLLNHLNDLGRPVPFKVEDVILRPEEELSTLPSGTLDPNDVDWIRELRPTNQSSIVSIGSPRSNHCTEVLLSDWFGARAFRDRVGVDRPFGFYWHDEQEFPGAFHLRRSGLKASKEFSERATSVSSAFWMRSQGLFEVIERREPGWTTYGVIVGKSCGDREKRVQMCICGLSGPATFGVAQLARQFAVPDDENFVSWRGVAVHVTCTEPGGLVRDRRLVARAEFLGDLETARIPK